MEDHRRVIDERKVQVEAVSRHTVNLTGTSIEPTEEESAAIRTITGMLNDIGGERLVRLRTT